MMISTFFRNCLLGIIKALFSFLSLFYKEEDDDRNTFFYNY